MKGMNGGRRGFRIALGDSGRQAIVATPIGLMVLLAVVLVLQRWAVAF